MATTDAAPIGVSDRTPPTGGAPRLDVTLWRPAEAPNSVALDDIHRNAEEIVWIDITSDGVNPEQLFEDLEPLLPGLGKQMLEDLLKPDPYPEGVPYADACAKLVSTFRVEAQDRDPNAKEHHDVFPGPGTLLLQPVEILGASDWLISCWHPCRIYEGIRPEKERRPAELCEPHRTEIAARWQGGLGKTSGDLGVLLMHELALSYAPAHRKLYDWLEEAELSLYVVNHVDEESLAQLWAYMTLLRHWLTPLNVAGLRIERQKAWLPNITESKEVERVDDRIDRSLASLRSLATALRSAFASVYSVEEQRGRDRREDTQRRVELIAAAFLVPTLVVGFYGANTWLPGQGSHTGRAEAFIEMAVGIIVFTSAVVVLLWLWHRSQKKEMRERNKERQRMANRLREPSAETLDKDFVPS